MKAKWIFKKKIHCGPNTAASYGKDGDAANMVQGGCSVPTASIALIAQWLRLKHPCFTSNKNSVKGHRECTGWDSDINLRKVPWLQDPVLNHYRGEALAWHILSKCLKVMLVPAYLFWLLTYFFPQANESQVCGSMGSSPMGSGIQSTDLRV